MKKIVEKVICKIVKSSKIIKCGQMIKGSQTIEAAIVMPIILITIISVMYFVFYLHDRVVIEMSAYDSAIESVFENKSIYSTAKQKIENLNTLAIRPTSIWTEENQKRNVKYIGKYVAPMAAAESFISNEIISESAYAYSKMKIRNMYVIKTIKNTIMCKSEYSNQREGG